MIGAALLASLMWGTADFLAGRASRLHPAAMVALVGQAAGLLALALILLFRGAAPRLPRPPRAARARGGGGGSPPRPGAARGGRGSPAAAPRSTRARRCGSR